VETGSKSIAYGHLNVIRALFAEFGIVAPVGRSGEAAHAIEGPGSVSNLLQRQLSVHLSTAGNTE
jgi:hypothetical protein